MSRPFATFIAPARSPARPVWTAIAIVLATFVISALAALGLAPYLPKTEIQFSAEQTLLILSLIALQGAVLAALLPLVHRRSICSVMGQNFLKGAASGAALGAAIFASLLLFGVYMLQYSLLEQPPHPNFAMFWPIALLLVMLQASTEEIIFRGYLAQQIAARGWGPLYWAVIPAVLFGALHYTPELPPEKAWSYVAATIIFGLAANYMTWRTGSLGMAIGLHVMTNWVALLIVSERGVMQSELALYSTRQSAPYEVLTGQLLVVALALGALEAPFSPLRRWLQTPQWGEHAQREGRSQ